MKDNKIIKEDDRRIFLLSKEKVSKSIILMATPAIIGLIVQAVYNMVDTMFVSWLGPTATGATQIAFVLYTAVAALGSMFGIGTSTYISRLLGRDKKEEASKVVSTVFVGAIIVGILVTIFSLIYIDPILKMVGATVSLLEMSREYVFYVSFSYLFMILNMFFNNSLRGEGSSRLSMEGMLVGAILNIILDPIFIFSLNMGIKGAAIATTISQIVTTLILLSHYFKGKTLLKIRLSLVEFSKKLWKEVLKIGFPTFVSQLLMSVSVSFVNKMAGSYGGDNAIAAIGIVTKLVFIVMYLLFGLGMGFQPIAGYSFGAKKNDRLISSIKFTLVLASCISFLCFIIIYFFGDNLLIVFKPTTEVLEYAHYYFRAFGVSILLMGVSINATFFYQAIGKGFAALFLGIARQGVFLIPLVLILPKYFGIKGVFVAQPIADIFLFFISAPLLINSIRKLKKGIL